MLLIVLRMPMHANLFVRNCLDADIINANWIAIKDRVDLARKPLRYKKLAIVDATN